MQNTFWIGEKKWKLSTVNILLYLCCNCQQWWDDAFLDVSSLSLKQLQESKWILAASLTHLLLWLICSMSQWVEGTLDPSGDYYRPLELCDLRAMKWEGRGSTKLSKAEEPAENKFRSTTRLGCDSSQRPKGWMECWRGTGGRKVLALSKTQSQWSLEYDKPNK